MTNQNKNICANFESRCNYLTWVCPTIERKECNDSIGNEIRIHYEWVDNTNTWLWDSNNCVSFKSKVFMWTLMKILTEEWLHCAECAWDECRVKPRWKSETQYQKGLAYNTSNKMVFLTSSRFRLLHELQRNIASTFWYYSAELWNSQHKFMLYGLI